ncbi:MAG: glycosyltransferase family 39 protein [Nitrospirota bacterium]
MYPAREWIGTYSGVLALTVGALALRLAFVQPEPIFPDSSTYLSISRAVVEEGKLSTTFREGGETFLPPLYPGLTAVVSGVVGRFTGAAYEWAAVLVSAVSGAAIVVPAWWLARTIFGAGAAWLAGCLVATSPILVHWSGHMLTEALFISIAVAAVAAGWRATQTQRPSWALVAGLLCGLAYLTRVIGLILIPAIGLWMIRPTGAARLDAQPDSRRMLTVSLFIAGFLAVSIPYWAYLRLNLGVWSVTGSYGSIVEQLVRGGIPVSGEAGRAAHRGLFATASNFFLDLGGYASMVWTLSSISLAFAVVSVLAPPRNATLPAYGRFYLATVVGTYLIALLLVGTVSYRGEMARYSAPVVPFILILACGGIAYIAERVGRARGLVIGGAVCALVFSFWVQISSVPGLYFFAVWRPTPPSPQRLLGLWMHDQLRGPLSVMSRKPYVPYFARATWYYTPATIDGVLSLARERHVDYLVVDRSVYADSRSEQARLLEPGTPPMSLELVAVQPLSGGGYFLALYRIKRT